MKSLSRLALLPDDSADRAQIPSRLHFHAANDYDTTLGTALAAELDRLHKPHLLKIYLPVGRSTDEGHNLLYLAILQREPDVFKFLDDYVKP